MEEHPEAISCSLSPAALAARTGDWGRALASGDRRAVEELIEAESECCPHLSFSVTPDGTLVIEPRRRDRG